MISPVQHQPYLYYQRNTTRTIKLHMYNNTGKKDNHILLDISFSESSINNIYCAHTISAKFQ